MSTVAIGWLSAVFPLECNTIVEADTPLGNSAHFKQHMHMLQPFDHTKFLVGDIDTEEVENQILELAGSFVMTYRSWSQPDPQQDSRKHWF